MQSHARVSYNGFTAKLLPSSYIFSSYFLLLCTIKVYSLYIKTYIEINRIPILNVSKFVYLKIIKNRNKKGVKPNAAECDLKSF